MATELTFTEHLMMGSIFALMAGVGIMMFSYATNMVLALNAPPTKRAAWTAGVPYAVVTVIMLFSLPLSYLWAAPLLPLLGLLVVFWFWRREYRRAWIETVDFADDTKLENDDWQAGLIRLIALIFFGVIASSIRYFARH